MDKLRIAICDDDALDLAETISMMQQYDSTNQAHISSFDRAVDLLECAVSSEFDIILLDIEMEHPNGYEIAKEIGKCADPPVIIFITKSSAYTLRGYGIALRYIQKPLDKDIFFEAMDAAILEATSHRLTLVADDTTIALRQREVLYIEMFGHYAVAHTKENEYRFRSSLKDVIAKLPRQYFAMPHKSIVVNFEHIKSATSSEITLDNGERIPVSRRRIREFNQAFHKFLGR